MLKSLFYPGTPFSATHNRRVITAETENFYQDLVEHQQDFIVMFGVEGRLLFVNSAYCDRCRQVKGGAYRQCIHAGNR